MTLDEILADPALKARFIAGGAELVAAEVAGKRGLGGMAIKAGYRAVTAIKPGIIEGALERLIPAFAPAIEPYFADGQAKGDVAGHFATHAAQIAEAMLQVTDAKARGAENKVMKRTYTTLRGQAHTHTTQAVPGVGRLLASFVA